MTRTDNLVVHAGHFFFFFFFLLLLLLLLLSSSSSSSKLSTFLASHILPIFQKSAIISDQTILIYFLAKNMLCYCYY
jgi:cytochrome b561